MRSADEIREAAITKMRAILMGTGGVTLSEVDATAEGLTLSGISPALDALEAAQRENERLRAEARTSAQRLIDLHDADMARASKALADVCAERDAAVAREARLRAAIETALDAFVTLGLSKYRENYDWQFLNTRPVLDGLRAALASVPPETQPEAEQ